MQHNPAVSKPVHLHCGLVPNCLVSRCMRAATELLLCMQAWCLEVSRWMHLAWHPCGTPALHLPTSVSSATAATSATVSRTFALPCCTCSPPRYAVYV